MITTKKAVEKLAKELNRDKYFRHTYFCTIALAFEDECAKYKKKTGKTNLSQEDIRIISENAANYYLDLFCGNIKYPEGR